MEKEMSGFLQDANGNKSSKRLGQILSIITGLLIGLVATTIAVVKSNDIGANIMTLTISLVLIGITGGVATTIANKGENNNLQK